MIDRKQCEKRMWIGLGLVSPVFMYAVYVILFHQGYYERLINLFN